MGWRDRLHKGWFGGRDETCYLTFTFPGPRAQAAVALKPMMDGFVEGKGGKQLPLTDGVRKTTVSSPDILAHAVREPRRSTFPLATVP